MEYLDQLLTVSGVVFMVVLAVVVLTLIYWGPSRRQREREQYIRTLFYELWTGEEADRPYAWFRVIQHLRQFHPDPQMIRMAEWRRLKSKEASSSAWMVDRKGKLVEGRDDDQQTLKGWGNS